MQSVGFLSRCLIGRAKLWEAYWLLGVPIAIACSLIATVATKSRATALVLVVWLPLQIFWGLAVWRCAPNTSWGVWRDLARAMVLLSWLSVVLAVVAVFRAA